MYSMFVILMAVLIMVGIFGLFGFLAWAAVKGLNELTEDIKAYYNRKRIAKMELNRM